MHGGASGIGTVAIQLAKANGARVICTAGTAEKLARCRALGADVAISYRNEDFVEVVKDATGGAGADVILDIMGASYLARNLSALATGGRLVIIGRQGGNRAELDLGVLQSKRASHPRDHAAGPPARGEGGHRVGGTGKCVAARQRGQAGSRHRPALPMSSAAEAHRILEGGDQTGKVLPGEMRRARTVAAAEAVPRSGRRISATD